MGKIKNTAENVVVAVAFIQATRGLYGLGREWIKHTKGNCPNKH